MTIIKTVKIHPALGIARIGNSPTQFFIGPELPGDRTVPNGGYKDGQRRIKRQAARFRLFGYDTRGRLVKELTARDGRITWTVHLANKKAAWKNFDGLNPNAPLRNAGIPDRSGLTKSDAKAALAALEEVVLEQLADAEKVRIGGVVQLVVRVKEATKPRQGRNPATGEEITISAKPASVALKARPLAKAKAALPSVQKARKRLT